MKTSVIRKPAAALIAALLIFAACATFAYAGTPIRPDSGYVNDAEQILSGEAVSQINEKAAALAEANGTGIYVLTVPDLGILSIANFSERVFSEWGLTAGDSLLVVSAQSSNYYLYCGGDVAEKITAPGMKVLLTNNMEDPFSRARMDEAVTSTVNALYEYQVTMEKTAGTGPIVKVLFTALIVLLVAAVLFVIAILALRARNRRIRAARRRRISAARRKPQPARRPVRSGRYNIIDIPRDEDDSTYVTGDDDDDDYLII